MASFNKWKILSFTKLDFFKNILLDTKRAPGLQIKKT